MKKILLYSDSAAFGGHELMSVKLANVLAGEHEVYFMFHNGKIQKELSSSVRQIRIPEKTLEGTLAFLRNINFRDIGSLRYRIRELGPDLSIILQPAIDFCLRGAMASKLEGIRTLSYIPNCFPASVQGAPFGALADVLFRFYYRIFDGFITINAVQRALINQITAGRGVVHVLENIVDVPSGDASLSGERHSGKILRIGVIGRVLIKQKGYDRVIRIADALRKKRNDFVIVIIGDGPDLNLLKHLVKEKDLSGYFDFKGWMDNRSEIYSSVDLILLVSGFEGTPLVLMEGLLYQKMVFGFLGDGTQILKEYLDLRWLFSSDSEAVEKLANAELYIKEFSVRKHEIREQVATRHSLEVFERSLFKIVESTAQ